MPAPRIDAYRFGRIVIEGEIFTHDVIILPDRVLPNWWRVEGHSLSIEDLQQALHVEPEVIVIGLGAFERMVISEKVRLMLEVEGVGLQAYATQKACEVYNDLRVTTRTVAGIHLTC